MRDFWVDRKQVTGFIGAIFIIFGIFLPVYSISLPVLGQFPVSIIGIPFIGGLIAIVLVAMGVLSIIAVAFREYSLLYLSGLVSLWVVMSTLVLTEAGLLILSANLPMVSSVINSLFDFEFGWVFLLSGSAFLLATPKIPD